MKIRFQLLQKQLKTDFFLRQFFVFLPVLGGC